MTLSPSWSVLPSVPRALVLGALLAAPAAAQLGEVLPAPYPAGSLRGDAALAALGDELPEVAARHRMTPEELVDAIGRQQTLWLTPDGGLFFVDIPVARDDDPSPSSYAGDDDIDPSEAFTLHSRPGADKVIHMDFDGHLSTNNSWGHTIDFPAYNTSGGSGTFTTGELNEIIAWWRYVAEDFEPFDVDVTTEEPPPGGLSKSGGGDTTWGVRCIITQPTDGFGNGIGGVAFLNSFDDSIDNPVFAFNKGTNTGSMTVSHEVGHAFGMSHDGLFGQEYHPGTGSGETSWGPIMGAPFGSNLVQWSKGEYAGATTTQNDIQIIISSSNGVNIMDDDLGDDETDTAPFGPAVGCPEPLPGSADGVIERRNDVDAFEFTTTGGLVTVDAVPMTPGGNLDIQIDLVTDTGAAVASANQEDELDATLTADLAAGTYVVLVDGVGKGDDYTDYASRGKYTVFVTLPGDESLANLGGSVPAGSGTTPFLDLQGTACAGNTITANLLTAPLNQTAFLVLGALELSAPFKGGVLVPDPTPPGSAIAFSTGPFGIVLLNTTWPAGLPAGLEVYLQYWITDPTAAFGFAATDGWRLVAP